MQNISRILCAYSELHLRVGSVVYVLPSSPLCCCPNVYSFASGERTGSFHCPYGPEGNGPFATYDTSIDDALLVDTFNQAYPYCHGDRNGPDRYGRCTVCVLYVFCMYTVCILYV